MNKINIFRNKSSKGVILGSLLLGSFAFSHVGNAYYGMPDEERIADANELCMAAKNGDEEEVKRLIRAGYELDDADSQGYSPLHYVCKPAIIELFKMGIGDLNVQHKKDGRTPLHFAIDRVAAEADNYDENDGPNDAMMAAIHCIAALLKNGAEVDIPDANRSTALHRIGKLIQKWQNENDERGVPDYCLFILKFFGKYQPKVYRAWRSENHSLFS
jgi:hypothetical protein